MQEIQAKVETFIQMCTTKYVIKILLSPQPYLIREFIVLIQIKFTIKSYRNYKFRFSHIIIVPHHQEITRQT